MILGEGLDALYRYNDVVDQIREKERSESAAASKSFAHLKTDVQSRIQLLVEPSSVLQKAYRDGAARNDTHIVEWNDWMSALRAQFERTAYHRNLGIIANYKRSQQSLPPEKQTALSIVRRIQDPKSFPNRGGLTSFIDSELQPVYSTYLHIFEPRYFSSVQRPVNPRRVSAFVRALSNCRPADLRAFLENELFSTEDAISELRRYLSQAESEYALAMCDRECMPRKQIVESPVYAGLQTELSKLVQHYRFEEKRFAAKFQEFVRAEASWADKLRKIWKVISSQDDEFNIVNSARRASDLDTQFLEYFDRLWSSPRLNLSAGRLASGFHDWQKQLPVFISLLGESESSGDTGILEGLYAELQTLKRRLSSGVAACTEFSRNSAQLIQDLHTAIPADTAFMISQIQEQRARIDVMASQTFDSHLARAREFQAAEDSIFVLLRNLGDFVGQPIADTVLGISSAGFAIPEVIARRRKLERLQQLLRLKEQRRNELRQQLDEHRRNAQPTPPEEPPAPTGESRRFCPGIDTRYTQARMALSCVICSQDAVYYSVGCGHLLCGTCGDKARRVKNPVCPSCRHPASDFVLVVF
jgi:hypothetical protein